LNRRRETAVGTVAKMEAEQAYLQYLERKGYEEYSDGGMVWVGPKRCRG